MLFVTSEKLFSFSRLKFLNLENQPLHIILIQNDKLIKVGKFMMS